MLISPEGEAAVIDAATSSGVSAITRLLDYFDIRTIETFVLTHPHADHVGGANVLLDKYRVKNIWGTDNSHTSETYRKFLNRVNRQGITYYRPTRGQRMELLPGLPVKILNPASRSYGDLNSISISFPIRMNGVGVLTSGDANARQENEWVSEGLVGDIDVLRVGHHGSRKSTSQRLLEATTPEVGIISAPRQSKHDHPHDEVLDRLKTQGVETYQTGFDGYVEVYVDPRSSNGSYSIRTFNYTDLFPTYQPSVSTTLLNSNRAADQVKNNLDYRGARSNNYRIDSDGVSLYAGDRSALWRYDATAPQLYYSGNLPERWLMETSLSLDLEWGREAGILLWQDQSNWLHWGPSGENSNTRLVVNRRGNINTVRSLDKIPETIALAYDGRNLLPLFKDSPGQSWKQLNPLSPELSVGRSQVGVYAKSWSDKGDYTVNFSNLELNQLE